MNQNSKRRTVRIGIISDTHNYLDPKVLEIFKGVDHILHGGDIGLPWVVLELESIAPVTAVVGNCDSDLRYKETEVLTLADRKFLIHHIVDPTNPSEQMRQALLTHWPDVVVFGHTHKPFCEKIGKTLFFNPGYAGKQRFNQPRSVSILECRPDGIKSEMIPL